VIRFSKPTIRRKDMNAVLQTMVDEKIGPGERKQEFNRLFCEIAGRKYGIMLRSYYDAIRYCLSVCKITNESIVGMSVLSPQLHALAVRSLGAKIKLGDIDPTNGCLSLLESQRLVEEGADVILLDEPMGMIPHQIDYSSLGVPLIEDITQSLGSSYDEDKAGMRGNLVICAFEEEDMISTAGGAAILYDDPAFKESFSVQLEGLHNFVELPDLNAALGVIQCMTFNEQLEKRRSFYRLFQKNLMKTHHKVFGIANADYNINGFGFAVQLDSRIEDVMKFASKYQVSSQKTFAGCVGSDMREDFGHFGKAIPFMLRCLSFPLYPFISQQDNDLLVKVISHLP